MGRKFALAIHVCSLTASYLLFLAPWSLVAMIGPPTVTRLLALAFPLAVVGLTIKFFHRLLNRGHWGWACAVALIPTTLILGPSLPVRLIHCSVGDRHLICFDRYGVAAGKHAKAYVDARFPVGMPVSAFQSQAESDGLACHRIQQHGEPMQYCTMKYPRAGLGWMLMTVEWRLFANMDRDEATVTEVRVYQFRDAL